MYETLNLVSPLGRGGVCLLLTRSSLQETMLFPHRKLVSAWAGRPPVLVQTRASLHCVPSLLLQPNPLRIQSSRAHTASLHLSLCLSSTDCGRGSSLQIRLVLQTYFQSHLQMSVAFALGSPEGFFDQRYIGAACSKSLHGVVSPAGPVDSHLLPRPWTRLGDLE